MKPADAADVVPVSLAGTDLVVPHAFDVHDADPSLPYWVGLAIQVQNGKATIHHVSVEPVDPSDPSGTVPFVARLPLLRWAREALREQVAAMRLNAADWTTTFEPADTRAARAAIGTATDRKPRFVTDDELLAVAAVYRANSGPGKFPGRAVARYLNAPDGSDVPWRRVQAARRRGFLAPTTPGRKGER